jgi:hypothetical protein
MKEDIEMATVQAIPAGEATPSWGFFFVLDMALAFLISYSVTIRALSLFVAELDTLLGDM